MYVLKEQQLRSKKQGVNNRPTSALWLQMYRHFTSDLSGKAKEDARRRVIDPTPKAAGEAAFASEPRTDQYSIDLIFIYRRKPNDQCVLAMLTSKNRLFQVHDRGRALQHLIGPKATENCDGS